MNDMKAMISRTGRLVRAFRADRRAATAVEYALVASGVGVAIAATVYALGTGVKTMFTTLSGLFPS